MYTSSIVALIPVTGDSEGLPVSILEALAAGIPAISTRHAGIPEVVWENVTGYLVEPGNTIKMSERLIQLAECQELRNRLGRNGSQLMRDEFSWDREKQSLLQVLGFS